MLTRPFWWLARGLFFRGENRTRNYAGYTARKKAVLRNGFLSAVHEISVRWDYRLQAFFKVVLPLRLGKNLLCDRYYYDTVISDLAPDLEFSPIRIRKTLDQYARSLPTPDVAFLLDVPESVSLSRKNDIVDAAYVAERRALYRELAQGGGLIVLDGTLPMDELRERAAAAILQGMPSEESGAGSRRKGSAAK